MGKGFKPRNTYKIFVALLIVLAVAVFLILESHKPKIEVVYFYDNPCGSCDPQGEFIELFNEQIGDEDEGAKVELLMFNTFHISGRNMAQEYFEKYQVPEDEQHTPIVFIGDKYLYGASRIEEGLRDTFIQAKNKKTVLGFIKSIFLPAVNDNNTDVSQNRNTVSLNTVDSSNESVIMYFYVTACSECQEVGRFFDGLKESYPLRLSGEGSYTKVNIKKHNIGQPENLDLVEEYFKTYKVPEEKQVVPIVFIGNTYLSGAEPIKEDLVQIIEEGGGLNTPVLKVEKGKGPSVESRLSGYKVLGVLSTGLINGLNPCSISMLLFFLSMLVVKSVNVLKMGLSFIAGKYITYFLLGTLFFNLFSRLDIPWFQTATKLVMLAVVLVIAALNIHDFFVARKEEYSKIKLELPRIFRKYNHNWIKKFTAIDNARLLFLISFGLGALISVGEFLCTGQIYLATILYVLQSSSTLNVQAAVYFLLYGLAFVSPLLVLTYVIHKGREIFDVSEFFRERMPLVKLINAAVFVMFGIVVILWF